MVAIVTTTPSLAHHSGAMFDHAHQVQMFGVVRLFQWSNPHCWIQLTVMHDAVAEEWSIEMAAPTELFRGGWRPGTLKTGDRIRVQVHPMRDGTRGALFISATGPEGQVLGKRT
jgi:hypothetical protein